MSQDDKGLLISGTFLVYKKWLAWSGMEKRRKGPSTAHAYAGHPARLLSKNKAKKEANYIGKANLYCKIYTSPKYSHFRKGQIKGTDVARFLGIVPLLRTL